MDSLLKSARSLILIYGNLREIYLCGPPLLLPIELRFHSSNGRIREFMEMI